MLIDRALALIDDLSDAERLQLAQAAISAVRVSPILAEASATPPPLESSSRGTLDSHRAIAPGSIAETSDRISEETLDAMDRAIESFNLVDHNDWK